LAIKEIPSAPSDATGLYLYELFCQTLEGRGMSGGFAKNPMIEKAYSPKISSNPFVLFVPSPVTVHPEPFDSPFVLSLSKDERHAQAMLVDG
jgi:hypothetical protein